MAQATDTQILDALEGMVLYSDGDEGYWAEQGMQSGEVLPDIWKCTLRQLGCEVRRQKMARVQAAAAPQGEASAQEGGVS